MQMMMTRGDAVKQLYRNINHYYDICTNALTISTPSSIYISLHRYLSSECFAIKYVENQVDMEDHHKKKHSNSTGLQPYSTFVHVHIKHLVFSSSAHSKCYLHMRGIGTIDIPQLVSDQQHHHHHHHCLSVCCICPFNHIGRRITLEHPLKEVDDIAWCTMAGNLPATCATAMGPARAAIRWRCTCELNMHMRRENRLMSFHV